MSFRDSAGHAAKNIAGDSPRGGEMSAGQRGRRVRVRHSLFSVISVLVNVQGKLCDRLRQNSHASVNGNDLHCRAVVDSLARMSPPKEVGVGWAVVAVLRLVP